MAKLSEKAKQKIGIAIMATVIGTFLLITYVYRPKMEQINEAKVAYEDAQKRCEAQMNVLDQLVPGANSALDIGMKMLETDHHKKVDELKEKETVLTKEEDVPQMINTIAGYADMADVEIVFIKQRDKVTDENLYDKIPVDLIVSGRYPGLLKFVRLAKDMPKLTIIEDVNLKVDEKNPPNLDASLTLAIFLKHEQ